MLLLLLMAFGTYPALAWKKTKTKTFKKKKKKNNLAARVFLERGKIQQ